MSIITSAMKDNFSRQSDHYRAFRPTYPVELYAFLLDHVQGRTLAWDVGTGNGQVAAAIAPFFQRILATDISENQLSHAQQAPNIAYEKRPAHDSGLPDGSVDLITVGQALHWFDLQRFYDEARRVLHPYDGLLAVWGYQLVQTGMPELDRLILHFYNDIVGPYWDPERKHVDNAYANLPLPFSPIDCPPFAIRLHWSAEQLTGFLHSWSGVQHYIAAEGHDPLERIQSDMNRLLPEGKCLDVRFPIFMKAGKVRG